VRRSREDRREHEDSPVAATLGKPLRRGAALVRKPQKKASRLCKRRHWREQAIKDLEMTVEKPVFGSGTRKNTLGKKIKGKTLHCK